MSDLNLAAVEYALDKYTDAVNELLRRDAVMALPEDAETFSNNYEDYERKSWLTTQA